MPMAASRARPLLLAILAVYLGVQMIKVWDPDLCYASVEKGYLWKWLDVGTVRLFAGVLLEDLVARDRRMRLDSVTVAVQPTALRAVHVRIQMTVRIYLRLRNREERARCGICR